MANVNEDREAFPDFKPIPRPFHFHSTSSVQALASRKTRSRSTSIHLESSPFGTPLNAEEQELSDLVQSINRNPGQSFAPLPDEVNESRIPRHRRHRGRDLTNFQLEKQKQICIAFEKTDSDCDFTDTDLTNLQLEKQKQICLDIQTELEADLITNNMNYQNYLDNGAAGPSNPRQAPPSPSQNMNHANGMNGGAMGIGGMVGFPTPAGHQSDLNYIMSMVEELSRQLEHNQRITDGVVDKIGKVREKASKMDLSNDELIALVASELSHDTKNLEKEAADLRKKLDKCEYDKDENWKLAIHGANILADILEKMHKFKEQHETDTLAWHKNYRKQLADEREENLALRNQINDMKASACRANGYLRGLRRAIADDKEKEEITIQNIALRQEKRWWKRKALPLLPDDDSEWSDDDDLIDPEEKKRLAALAAESVEKNNQKDNEGDGGSGQGLIA